MPAYMTDIETGCQANGCTRRATKEVRNTYNRPVGKYCKKCADKKLKALLELERTSYFTNEPR